jgi:hypothetical protein
MPPFGARKASPAESKPPEPVPPALTPTERLNALLIEQAELQAVVADRQAERARLLREAEAPSLGAVTAIATETDQAKLRLEWIAGQLPGIYAEVERERAEAWEAEWQLCRPQLAAAQARLVSAIGEFYGALREAHVAHTQHRAFGARMTNEFVRPPPAEPLSDWALRQFLLTVEQRRQSAAAVTPIDTVAEAIELTVDEQPATLWRPKFVPRRVSQDELQAISPLAPMRTVKVLHGPLRMLGLLPGYSRVQEGAVMTMPARAAYAVVHSGAGEYVDDVQTGETAA